MLLDMSEKAKQVLDLAMALSNDERRFIVHALLDAMSPEDTSEIEAAWLDDSRGRAGRVERGEVQTRNGEEALAQIEQRLRNSRGA